jgi:dipeptidyl aminopeptidase/acylaminoacyl peptidase
MERDLRDTAVYREAEASFKELRQPGTGQLADLTDVHVSPDGRRAVFAGALLDELKGSPTTRICLTDLDSGDIRVLTFGPNVDRAPKFSPDGRTVAFLSDRESAGEFQLFLLDPLTGRAGPTPAVNGWVEYLHWSPDGRRILLGVAGHGADIAGAQGAIASQQRRLTSVPSWMPTVQAGDESHEWRQAWIYELETRQVRKVSPPGFNLWETVWCGPGALAAIVSSGPKEGSWYTAHLQLIALDTGEARVIYQPQDQLGWPSAPPSGSFVALVEAVCSDRGLVAGDVLLIETASGQVRRLDTRGVDVTCCEWRSDRVLMLAGHRGSESVVGLYEPAVSNWAEVWASDEITTAGTYLTVSGFGVTGDFAIAGEGFLRAPEIAVVRQGRYTRVVSVDAGYAAQASAAIRSVEQVHWKAPDGWDIQGWLLLPNRSNKSVPHALVTVLHGGPVWHWRPRWLGRAGIHLLMLLKRGYAIFFPNPRGSSGRGQAFARAVSGDVGGADARDILAGIDQLVHQGLADAGCLGVMGVSYGGFMTSWLITQDERFAAAVSISPITNQVTEHLLSNIPHFSTLFVGGVYSDPQSQYFQRSPVMYIGNVRTPVLNICGARDRCTPPEEAVQFHNALVARGATSVLVIYPEEGHGVNRLPAAIDFTARAVAWFDDHFSRVAQKS